MKVRVSIDKAKIRKLQERIKDFGDDAVEIIQKETEITANEIRTKAIRNKNSYGNNVSNAIGDITVAKETNYFYTVNVQNVPIAAYLEFGTGAKVDIPDEWKELAWQFYVNGQGHLPPHPYFYDAYHYEATRYITQLRKALKYLKTQ